MAKATVMVMAMATVTAMAMATLQKRESRGILLENLLGCLPVKEKSRSSA